MKTREKLRNIPSVDKILKWPELQEGLKTLSNKHVTQVVRDKIEDFRARLIAGEKLTPDVLKQSIL